MDINVAVSNLIRSYPFVALTVLLLANMVMGALNALRPDEDGKRRFTALELTDICKKVVPYIGAYFVLGTSGEVLQSGYGELLKALGSILPGIALALGSVKNALSLLHIQLPAWLAWLYPPKLPSPTAPGEAAVSGANANEPLPGREPVLVTSAVGGGYFEGAPTIAPPAQSAAPSCGCSDAGVRQTRARS